MLIKNTFLGIRSGWDNRLYKATQVEWIKEEKVFMRFIFFRDNFDYFLAHDSSYDGRARAQLSNSYAPVHIKRNYIHLEMLTGVP